MALLLRSRGTLVEEADQTVGSLFEIFHGEEKSAGDSTGSHWRQMRGARTTKLVDLCRALLNSVILMKVLTSDSCQSFPSLNGRVLQDCGI